MDCVIRVIKGPDAGAVYALQSGVTLIGRSGKAGLRLTPQDISWEHVTITRNGSDYVVENLSALGTYLDDAKITGPVKLRPRDQLRLSKETVLRFETVGTDTGLLTSRRSLIVLLIVMLVAIAGYVLWDLTSPPKATDDWGSAYTLLEPWVARESQAGRIPADSAKLFRDAWRLEQAGDFERSAPLWLRLQMALDSVEEKQGLQAAAEQHPSALQQILTPIPAPVPGSTVQLSDQETSAAVSQFVKRRLKWSSLQARNLRSTQ